MKVNAALLCDFYKIGHRVQYPVGTEYVYSNYTPRKNRPEAPNYVVFFGLQSFIQEWLVEYFNENFFDRPWPEVKAKYEEVISAALGPANADSSHLKDLWDLGYLPLEIRALPEGTIVPVGIPVLTVENTDPKFFWLTNYIETLMSAQIWKTITSATIAREYRAVLDRWANATDAGNANFVEWQGHDFSFRGMDGVDSAMRSGAAHLLSFSGTDTIPAIEYIKHYYGGNFQAGSVPATEHSVACAFGNENVVAVEEEWDDATQQWVEIRALTADQYNPVSCD